ncbi:MAG: Rep family protein [Collinsella sp.]
MAGENSNNSNGRKASKTRHWAFIVYPESAPKNWLSILEDLHMQALVSPLHDKDQTASRPKKPHWHVCRCIWFVSQKRADEIIEPFGGTKSAEYV